MLGENDFFGTDRLVSEALLQLSKDAIAALQNAANDRAGRRALVEPLCQIREKLLASESFCEAEILVRYLALTISSVDQK